MDCFIQSYLNELKTDDIKLFIENSVKGGFSEELKRKMETFISEFKFNHEDIKDSK